MTFGSARTADEVPGYLRSVRGGGEPDPALVAEFRRRYELVGWSPLLEITRRQAQLLESCLNESAGTNEYLVRDGMLHSEPRIEAVVTDMASAGVTRLLGIVLSPQYSPVIMSRYNRTLQAAVKTHLPAADTRVAGAWHTMPSFVAELADRVAQALDRLPAQPPVPVIFTAHSLPRAVVDRDPEYIAQLHETIGLVVQRLDLPSERWQFAYQSAGHTPEEWLKPDLKDLLPGLRSAGHRDVLVAPVQFLADHLEILYDLDVAARQEASDAGLRFHRIELPNTSPTFIRALAEVVRSSGLS
jgi:ferrochelatase